jgi:hypothetical protein
VAAMRLRWFKAGSAAAAVARDRWAGDFARASCEDRDARLADIGRLHQAGADERGDSADTARSGQALERTAEADPHPIPLAQRPTHRAQHRPGTPPFRELGQVRRRASRLAGTQQTLQSLDAGVARAMSKLRQRRGSERDVRKRRPRSSMNSCSQRGAARSWRFGSAAASSSQSASASQGQPTHLPCGRFRR